MSKIMRLLGCGFAVLLVGLYGASASGQDCDCDHEIGLEVQVMNGQELGIKPGDRVCIMAGQREFLRIKQVQGEAGNPVVIMNCGGQVSIRNTDRAYALIVEDQSKYFHLTGTGSDDKYGFRVSAPDKEPYPGIALWFNGLTTNYEADHIEVYETGFAGVMSKTDPTCDGLADQDKFVQSNVSLHDLWVHDTGGEGFYIGSTQANGHTITCNGAAEVHQPHFLDGISFYNNIIENTGWDGMQIGMARTGCVVKNNIIRNVGSAGEEYQQQGMQIGSFSKCEISGNLLENGPTNGIFVMEADSTKVWNNVVRDFKGDGIYANLRDRFEGVTYEFYFNTFEAIDGAGIRVFGPKLGPSAAKNNLVIGGGGVEAGGDVDWSVASNLSFDSIAAAGLNDDLTPQDGAAVLSAGVTLPGITTDKKGGARPEPPAVGAYELETAVVVDPPDAGVDFGTETDMGMTSTSADSGVTDGGMISETSNGTTALIDDGCSQAGGASSWPLLLLGLFAWVRRR